MRTLKILFILMLFLTINRIQAQPNTSSQKNRHTTFISGKIDPDQKHDTLSLVIHGPFNKYGGLTEEGAKQVLKTTANNQGEFEFKIVTGDSSFHMSLISLNKRNNVQGSLKGKNYINTYINNYLIEAGDSIHVIFKENKTICAGRGKDLFNAQYMVEETDKGRVILTHDVNDDFRNDIKKWLKQKDSLLNAQLRCLADYQYKLSPNSYRIVCADIIGVNRAWVYRRINFAGPFFIAGMPLNKDLNDLCTELQSRPDYINVQDKSALSPKYIHYLYDKLRTEVKHKRILNNIDVFLDQDFFPAINKQYKGELRDKLLSYWLIHRTAFNDLRPEYFEAALSVMQNPEFIKTAENFKDALAEGTVVTDFNFKDPKGKNVRLADFKGKVLLIDLWFSGCTGCVAIATGLPKVEEAFKDRKDVAFISISIDKDKKLWLQSINKTKSGKHYTHYTTPTTIYLYTAGTGQNNPFIKKYVPNGSFPSLMIIDKAGKILSTKPTRPITDQGREDLIKELKLAISKE